MCNQTRGVTQVRRGTAVFVGSVFVLCAVSGCIGRLVGVNVQFLGRQTALENQVLGAYRSLNTQLLSFASVRAVDDSGKLQDPPPMTESRRRVMMAMQSQEFNRDDILDFKKRGYVGENNQGLLTIFADHKGLRDPARKKFVEAIVTEENADRMVIMKRVIEMNVELSDEDLPKVQRIFANLNRDNARPGERIELDNGTWVTK